MSESKRPEHGHPRNEEPADKPTGPHHVADEPVADPGAGEAGIKSPVTSTGLPVEEQVRKEWDPKKDGGLPTDLPPPSGESTDSP